MRGCQKESEVSHFCAFLYRKCFYLMCQVLLVFLSVLLMCMCALWCLCVSAWVTDVFVSVCLGGYKVTRSCQVWLLLISRMRSHRHSWIITAFSCFSCSLNVDFMGKNYTRLNEQKTACYTLLHLNLLWRNSVCICLTISAWIYTLICVCEFLCRPVGVSVWPLTIVVGCSANVTEAAVG